MMDNPDSTTTDIPNESWIDRLAPPEQAEILWNHWDRCAFHWFPGNHVLHVSQPDYLRRMTRFMADFMFD